MASVLKLRDFTFDAPKNDKCDLLIIAGEHSGDEQASRMLKEALKKSPDLSVCAFGGLSLAEAGAHLIFDMTSFSVVGFAEVVKNYSFFKRLSVAIIDWIITYKPKAVCFVDYPGLNLHLASELKKRGVSVAGGGEVKMLYYISPQIWAWKAKRRFKMAQLLDALAVIFPFEPDCYADTSLKVDFVGHPFLSSEYVPPVRYSPDGEILLLSGSREIAVSRIFPIMLDSLALLKGERAVVVYPTEKIRTILETALDRRPALKDRVRIIHNGGEQIALKAAMMSSGTMSLSCSLEGIPGAIVYKANPLTYIIGRALVKIKYLSIANIILDKPAWREFIQFDASAKSIATYMKECLKPAARKEFEDYANTLKNLLSVDSEHTAASWLIANVGK